MLHLLRGLRVPRPHVSQDQIIHSPASPLLSGLLLEQPPGGLKHLNIQGVPDKVTIHVGYGVTGGEALQKEGARIALQGVTLTAVGPPGGCRLVSEAVLSELTEDALLLGVFVIGQGDILGATVTEDLEAVLSEGASFIKDHKINSPGDIHTWR